MDKPNKPVLKRNFGVDVLFFIIALFGVFLIRDFLLAVNNAREIPHSAFVQLHT